MYIVNINFFVQSLNARINNIQLYIKKKATVLSPHSPSLIEIISKYYKICCTCKLYYPMLAEKIEDLTQKIIIPNTGTCLSNKVKK